MNDPTPRALANLQSLTKDRNRVEIDQIRFANGLPAEVQFVVIMDGRRASLILGAVPDELCDDMPRVVEWANEQIRAIVRELTA